DSIKCFGIYPTIDITKSYEDLAKLLVKCGVKAEQSAGLHLNYNHPEAGMNKLMLQIFKTAGVDIITASDAHSPENTGLCIAEMALLL
ncbi:MAG TPA: histidinol phosphate phosphatase, partial [Clostridia bacterium]